MSLKCICTYVFYSELNLCKECVWGLEGMGEKNVIKKDRLLVLYCTCTSVLVHTVLSTITDIYGEIFS